MNYILVGKENAGDFENVLFPGFDAEKKRVTIGAYEDDGTGCELIGETAGVNYDGLNLP